MLMSPSNPKKMLDELSKTASAANDDAAAKDQKEKEENESAALDEDLDLDAMPEAERKQLEELAQQQDLATAQALAFKVRATPDLWCVAACFATMAGSSKLAFYPMCDPIPLRP